MTVLFPVLFAVAALVRFLQSPGYGRAVVLGLWAAAAYLTSTYFGVYLSLFLLLAAALLVRRDQLTAANAKRTAAAAAVCLLLLAPVLPGQLESTREFSRNEAALAIGSAVPEHFLKLRSRASAAGLVPWLGGDEFGDRSAAPQRLYPGTALSLLGLAGGGALPENGPPPPARALLRGVLGARFPAELRAAGEPARVLPLRVAAPGLPGIFPDAQLLPPRRLHADRPARPGLHRAPAPLGPAGPRRRGPRRRFDGPGPGRGAAASAELQPREGRGVLPRLGGAAAGTSARAGGFAAPLSERPRRAFRTGAGGHAAGAGVREAAAERILRVFSRPSPRVPPPAAEADRGRHRLPAGPGQPATCCSISTAPLLRCAGCCGGWEPWSCCSRRGKSASTKFCRFRPGPADPGAGRKKALPALRAT